MSLDQNQGRSRHYLRSVFVDDEWKSNMLPQFLYEANLRTLQKLMVHSDSRLPARVLNAYRIGAEHDLITEAEIDLDLETIRTILDPDLLEQKKIER